MRSSVITNKKREKKAFASHSIRFYRRKKNKIIHWKWIFDSKYTAPLWGIHTSNKPNKIFQFVASVVGRAQEKNNVKCLQTHFLQNGRGKETQNDVKNKTQNKEINIDEERTQIHFTQTFLSFSLFRMFLFSHFFFWYARNILVCHS